MARVLRGCGGTVARR